MTRLPLAVVVLLLSACTVNRPVPGSSEDTGSCLPSPRASAQAAVSVSGAGPPFPDVALACFDGSGVVHTGQLTGPAVVNLWASWCEPCRTELPAFERFARQAGGQVAVVGVDIGDTRSAAQSVIDDLGLTFPMLFDDRSDLRYALDNRPLPITVFVDGGGRIAHIYNDVALDAAALAGLVARHLGVQS